MKKVGIVCLVLIALIVLIVGVFIWYPDRTNEKLRSVKLGLIVEQEGIDFIFEACDILEENYFDSDSIKYSRIFNAALNAISDELDLCGIKFTPITIEPECSKEETKKIFTFEFNRSQIFALPVKDSIGHLLEFAATDSMLGSIGDSHCYFLDPETTENREKYQNSKPIFPGIGVSVGNINGVFYFEDVFPNGPAKKSGLKRFDQLIMIDSIKTSGKDSDSILQLLRGKKGSTISLTIKRSDSIFSAKVLRDSIVRPFFSIDTIKSQGKDFVHIRLYSFMIDKYGMNFIKEYLVKIQEGSASGIIIDLRGNLGGYVVMMEQALQCFLGKGTTGFYLTGKDNKKTREYITEEDSIVKLPTVVLVDERSASCAEIFPAVMQENRKAIIVGQKTSGSVNVSYTYKLSFGSSMVVSKQQLFTAQGKKLEKFGVTPDVLVEYDKKDVLRGVDSQLQKCVDILECASLNK
ncbi:MAG: S41 family peptidase [Candidatus Paceibacterota bacterium]|jgi:carboxyl-terminal processing protease